MKNFCPIHWLHEATFATRTGYVRVLKDSVNRDYMS